MVLFYMSKMSWNSHSPNQAEIWCSVSLSWTGITDVSQFVQHRIVFFFLVLTVLTYYKTEYILLEFMTEMNNLLTIM